MKAVLAEKKQFKFVVVSYLYAVLWPVFSITEKPRSTLCLAVIACNLFQRSHVWLHSFAVSWLAAFHRLPYVWSHNIGNRSRLTASYIPHTHTDTGPYQWPLSSCISGLLDTLVNKSRFMFFHPCCIFHLIRFFVVICRRSLMKVYKCTYVELARPCRRKSLINCCWLILNEWMTKTCNARSCRTSRIWGAGSRRAGQRWLYAAGG